MSPSFLRPPATFAPEESRLADAAAFGAVLLPDGGVRFRLWAPSRQTVTLVLEDRGLMIPMAAQPGGWHEAVSREARAGTRYRFALSDGTRVADPASRYQPDDVSGP